MSRGHEEISISFHMQAAELPVEICHHFNSFLKKNEQLAHLSYHLVNVHFNFISVCCVLLFVLITSPELWEASTGEGVGSPPLMPRSEGITVDLGQGWANSQTSGRGRLWRWLFDFSSLSWLCSFVWLIGMGSWDEIFASLLRSLSLVMFVRNNHSRHPLDTYFPPALA